MSRPATHRQHHQPLPAYGRELLELRRQGLVPAHHLVLIALDSWKWGRSSAGSWYRLVISPEHDPAELDFSMVAGLDVLLCYAPAVTLVARRDAAIRKILRANPASLRVIDMVDPQLGFFIKSRKRGIELPEYAT